VLGSFNFSKLTQLGFSISRPEWWPVPVWNVRPRSRRRCWKIQRQWSVGDRNATILGHGFENCGSTSNLEGL